MRTLICIPTYNEAENIGPLIRTISSFDLGFDILVIDDESPDGTASIVKNILPEFSHVRLIKRVGTRGFGSAYLAGFSYGLENQYDFIGEMDADFSHPPEALKDVKRMTAGGDIDFLVGSRYVAGGSTVDWGPIRQFISQGGNLYARTILGLPIKDLTGGFNSWSRNCLEKIDISSIMSDGYVFQIELKARACRLGMRYIEYPITFEDRRVGKSKMSGKIVLEAVLRVWTLRRILRKLSSE